MTLRLKTDPTIARLAADLNLRSRSDPSGAIVQECHRKIQAFLQKYPCTTLAELLDVAKANLGTVFIDIRDDDQLAEVERQYVERGEVGFVNLKQQLSPDVYAITFVLSHPGKFDRPFVSIIDCRGAKRYRSYFSKWHELAHLLTLTAQLRLKFRRTHAEPAHKDPEEALMDVIAGELGYFPGLVARHAQRPITFDAIEELREKLCPEASRTSAILGFVKAWPRPCLLLQGRLATRKEHQQQDGFDFYTAPSMALRAVKVTSNERARATGLMIPPNMRVPERSVIHSAFVRRELLLAAEEDLAWWESQGVTRPTRHVHVEARARQDYVEALITT